MKNNSPKIRFFSEDVKRKINTLEEVAIFNPKSSVPRKFKYVDLESVIGTELIAYRDEIAETAPSRAQRLAKNGDIFYQTVRPYQKNNLFFDLKDEDYVFSSGYAQLRPLIDGYYLFSQLQDTRFVETVLEMCTGTSYPAINSKTLSKIEINIPNNEEELKKIGVFFKQLDEIISLQQQELDALKQTKQGFLQKMFPKGENIIPELRFSEFNDPWFITELSDIVSEISTGKSKHVKSDSKGNYKILGSTGVIGYGDSYEYEGDFLLTARVGANAGQLYKYSGKVKITDNTVFIKGDNLTFIHPLLEFFDLKKLSFGSGQPLIKTSELKKLKLRVPLPSEQVKIGKFFRQLDEVIKLKEQELEVLIQTKKGFLQKMFV